MCDNAKHIKLGYIVAEGLWFVYAAENNLLEMYYIHAAMTALGLIMVYKDRIISALQRHIKLPLSAA